MRRIYDFSEGKWLIVLKSLFIHKTNVSGSKPAHIFLQSISKQIAWSVLVLLPTQNDMVTVRSPEKPFMQKILGDKEFQWPWSHTQEEL